MKDRRFPLLALLGLMLLGFTLSAQAPVKQEPAKSDPDWTTQTFEVKYIDPNQLRDIFSGRSFVMEANRDLKVLTAHGSAAFLKEVEEAVKQFDVQPPLPSNIQVTVYLLTVAAQAPSGRALPSELAGVTKEMTVAGSPPLRLADSQMIRVRAGEPGEATGLAGAPEAAILSRIRIQSASLTPGPKGDILSLNGLHVWFNVPAAETAETKPAGSSQDKTDADISANIDVNPNQAVVVSNTGVDKPVVIVVRANVVR